MFSQNQSEIEKHTLVEVSITEKETGKYKRLIIVDRTHICDDQSDGKISVIIHRDAPLCVAVLEALGVNERSFPFNNSHYEIGNVSPKNPYSIDRIQRNESLNLPDMVEIELYGHNKFCGSRGHKIEDVTANVFCIWNDNKPVKINVSYCLYCQKYYIEQQSYWGCVEKYGGLYVSPTGEIEPPRHKNKNDYLDDYDCDYSKLKECSRLRALGYTVNATDNLKSLERQKVLVFAIETGQVEKHEAISHINYLMNRSKNNIALRSAFSKWQEDLEFVNDYGINRQREVFGTIISRSRKVL